MFDDDQIGGMSLFLFIAGSVVVNDSRNWRHFIELCLISSLFCLGIYILTTFNIISSIWNRHGTIRIATILSLAFSVFFTLILLFSAFFYARRLRCEERKALEQKAKEETWRREEQAKEAERAAWWAQREKAREEWRAQNPEEAKKEDAEIEQALEEMRALKKRREAEQAAFEAEWRRNRGLPPKQS